MNYFIFKIFSLKVLLKSSSKYSLRLYTFVGHLPFTSLDHIFILQILKWDINFASRIEK